MTKLGNSPKVLGLDISTKTIGWALFDIQSKELLELTHFSPKVKPKPENKLVEMMDMREAQRSYEANLSAIRTSRSMLNKTLELLR